MAEPIPIRGDVPGDEGGSPAASGRRPGRASSGPYLYATLRDAIVRAELPPGERLSENELAERLGVSRTPVREALIRLRDERLVQIVPSSAPSSRRSARRPSPTRSSSASRSSAPPCALAAERADAATSTAQLEENSCAPRNEVSDARRHDASRCSTTSSTRRSASSPATRSPGRSPSASRATSTGVRRLSLPQPRLPDEMVEAHGRCSTRSNVTTPTPPRRAAPPPAAGPARRCPRSANSTPTISRSPRWQPSMAIAHRRPCRATLRADAPDPRASRPRPSASTRRRGSAATATSPPARRRRRSARRTRCDADDLLVTGYRCHGFALARGVPAGGGDGGAVRPRRRLRPRPRRLDAPARRLPRLLRRLGDRRRSAADRDRAGALAGAPGAPAGRALRARRRRDQHGRLARVAQPGRGLAACRSCSSS